MIQIQRVSEVTRYLRELLDADEVLQDLWMEGEVSNFSRSSAGHVYFTLKDDASALSCVLFRGYIERGVKVPENGLQVVVHARLSVYEPRGTLQLYVDLVERAGLGELALQFEFLKARLAEDGLLEATRKRPLPAFPKRIGVVTSPTGAVIHDIINIVGRRYPLAEIVLSPAAVQGADAADSICQALRAVEEYGECDVVILARGGGSIEELWPFNEEKVARAIYACRIPVVSGVGHETDVTIADLVADVRAPTPSGAAELVVPDVQELRSQVRAQQLRLWQRTAELLASRRAALEQVQVLLFRLSPVDRLAYCRQQSRELSRRMVMRIQYRLAVQREQVDGRQRQLSSLSPLAILDRGYALCRHLSTREIVHSVAQASPGDSVEVRVSDGSFRSKVCTPERRRGKACDDGGNEL
ncbi:MAG: exodeoxyribonuclease VII large subunit [Bacteroidetes bacterium]|nr:exodeoxyribonuclease VII large subunit [Bacteroidota bacterium]MCL5027174.1 exodeoxyribonuclease VII large subunit [Chloroflexota bacterium]